MDANTPKNPQHFCKETGVHFSQVGWNSAQLSIKNVIESTNDTEMVAFRMNALRASAITILANAVFTEAMKDGKNYNASLGFAAEKGIQDDILVMIEQYKTEFKEGRMTFSQFNL